MITAYALIALVMICTTVCYRVAKKRKADVRHWVMMGALLGPFAIPFVFFSRPKNSSGS